MEQGSENVEIRRNLGKRIRTLRKQQSLTQEQLGLMVGIERSYICHVENGRRNISIDNLAKIARGFDITLSELLEGVDGDGGNLTPLSAPAKASVEYRHISF